MLVIHAYVLNKDGSTSSSFDLMRNDGKDTFKGVDIKLPFNKDYPYPLFEDDVINLINNKDIKVEEPDEIMF